MHQHQFRAYSLQRSPRLPIWNKRDLLLREGEGGKGRVEGRERRRGRGRKGRGEKGKGGQNLASLNFP